MLWFLAIDPDAAHETGEPLRWENKLTLTHERITLPGGKRRVELTIKPRGVIRWNTTGANPKEGTIYSGPIDVPGDSEVTIYAYAEDSGVGAARSFAIPRADQVGPSIDKSRPARLRRKLDFRGSTDAFVALVEFDALQVTLANGVSLSVGEGSAAITTRFGSDATIRAADLRRGSGRRRGFAVRGEQTPTRIQIALDALQVRPHLGGLLVTQIAILFERFVGDFFQPGRQIRVQANRRDWSLVEDRVEYCGGRVAAEGQRSRGHLVEHRAERKRSVRWSSSFPSACSGDIYDTVPNVVPGLVRCWSVPSAVACSPAS